MKTVIFLGAPGSGKGTIADEVRSASGCLHISTGEILREAVAQGTTAGNKAESFMKRGELVPDGIILELLDERLDAAKPDDSFILDGFPRNIEQANMLEVSLDRRGKKVDQVIFLDAPREILIQRLTGRRICKSCGTGYHVTNIPPKKEGVCDRCGGELYQRPDDQEKTIVNRLEVYRKQTESLIDYYEKKGILVRMNSDRAIPEITAELLEILKPKNAL